MKYKAKIGVMGSAANSLSQAQLSSFEPLISELAKAIAIQSCALITGETSGIPGKVAEKAAYAGVLTIGISPAHNAEEQSTRYPSSFQASDIVIYTGFGLKGRNVINIRSSDIVIIFSGSIGTLNEFTIAYDEGKIIGVLIGTGGVADELQDLLKKLPKQTGAITIYEQSPSTLLEKCLIELEKRRAQGS